MKNIIDYKMRKNIKDEKKNCEWLPEKSDTLFLQKNIPTFFDNGYNYDEKSFLYSWNNFEPLERKPLIGQIVYDKNFQYKFIGFFGNCGIGKTNLMITLHELYGYEIYFSKRIKSINDISFSSDFILDAINELDNINLIIEIIEICSKKKIRMFFTFRDDLGIDYKIYFPAQLSNLILYENTINYARLKFKNNLYYFPILDSLTKNIRTLKLLAYFIYAKKGKNNNSDNFFLNLRNSIEQVFKKNKINHLWDKFKNNNLDNLNSAELKDFAKIGFISQWYGKTLTIDRDLPELINNIILSLRNKPNNFEYNDYIDYIKDNDITKLKNIESYLLANIHNRISLKGVHINEKNYDISSIIKYIPFLKGDIDLLREEFYLYLYKNLKDYFYYSTDSRYKIFFAEIFSIFREKNIKNYIGFLLLYLTPIYSLKIIYGSFLLNLEFHNLVKLSDILNDFYLFTNISYLLRRKMFADNLTIKEKKLIIKKEWKQTMSFEGIQSKYFSNNFRTKYLNIEQAKELNNLEHIVPINISKQLLYEIDHVIFHYERTINNVKYKRDLFFNWLKKENNGAIYSKDYKQSSFVSTKFERDISSIFDWELFAMDKFNWLLTTNSIKEDAIILWRSQFIEWNTNHSIKIYNFKSKPLFLANDFALLNTLNKIFTEIKNIIDNNKIIYMVESDPNIDENYCLFIMSLDIRNFNLCDYGSSFEDEDILNNINNKKFCFKKIGYESECDIKLFDDNIEMPYYTFNDNSVKYYKNGFKWIAKSNFKKEYKHFYFKISINKSGLIALLEVRDNKYIFRLNNIEKESGTCDFIDKAYFLNMYKKYLNFT